MNALISNCLIQRRILRAIAFNSEAVRSPAICSSSGSIVTFCPFFIRLIIFR